MNSFLRTWNRIQTGPAEQKKSSRSTRFNSVHTELLSYKFFQLSRWKAIVNTGISCFSLGSGMLFNDMLFVLENMMGRNDAANRGRRINIAVRADDGSGV